MVAVLLANGFEEIEALCPADLLMRAGHDVKLISINDTEEVIGTHKIKITADTTLSKISVTPDNTELLFLPGGMPGALNLYNDDRVKELVRLFDKNEKPIAAICAAPLVFGRLGILEGRRATCYPSFENELLGALLSEKAVERDGHVVTGAGMGASFELGCTLIELLDSVELAEKVKMSTMVDGKKL